MPVSYFTVLVAAAIGVIPVFGWVWLVAKRNDYTIANGNYLIKIFFWGVLSAIPASTLEIFLNETGGENQIIESMQRVWDWSTTGFWLTGFVSAGIVAFIEEISKGFVILVSVFRKKRLLPNEGMIIGLLVGLAFGVTENGVYFVNAINQGMGADLITTVILRFVLSTSAHIIYSASMGTLIAEGRKEENLRKKYMFYVLAVMVPVVIHAVFNFMLTTMLSWLVSVIVIFGLVILGLRFIINKPNIKESI